MLYSIFNFIVFKIYHTFCFVVCTSFTWFCRLFTQLKCLSHSPSLTRTSYPTPPYATHPPTPHNSTQGSKNQLSNLAAGILSGVVTLVFLSLLLGGYLVCCRTPVQKYNPLDVSTSAASRRDDEPVSPLGERDLGTYDMEGGTDRKNGTT